MVLFSNEDDWNLPPHYYRKLQETNEGATSSSDEDNTNQDAVKLIPLENANMIRSLAQQQYGGLHTVDMTPQEETDVESSQQQYPPPRQRQRQLKKHTKKAKRHRKRTAINTIAAEQQHYDTSPSSWHLGKRVAATESLYPFGGSIPIPELPGEYSLDISHSLKRRQSSSSSSSSRLNLHLNWATADNPDGIPLVHEVMDQGKCGSCWAYVATGSVETSVARGIGQWAMATMKNGTIATARQLASTIFHTSRLSIQELLDCDTTVDQGCIGGNPLLAYYYIQKYGLSGWKEYPYQEAKSWSTSDTDKDDHDRQCQRDLSFSQVSAAPSSGSDDDDSLLPIATVDAWGILPPNREDLIQVALRYIGPVAVAMNGASLSFLEYQGGIWNEHYCKSNEANHAVLITGYGQEVDTKANTTTKYWIARNSWGTDWGEDGYIRIQRRDNDDVRKSSSGGVCGIAKSPSVALGGRLLGDSSFAYQTVEEFYQQQKEANMDWWAEDLHSMCRVLTPTTSLAHLRCDRLVQVMDHHWAAGLGLLSLVVVIILAWSLTYTCRRQKMLKQRRRRLILLQQQQQQLANTASNSARALQHHDTHHDEYDEERAGTFSVLEDDLDPPYANEHTRLLQASVPHDAEVLSHTEPPSDGHINTDNVPWIHDDMPRLDNAQEVNDRSQKPDGENPISITSRHPTRSETASDEIPSAIQSFQISERSLVNVDDTTQPPFSKSRTGNMEFSGNDNDGDESVLSSSASSQPANSSALSLSSVDEDDSDDDDLKGVVQVHQEEDGGIEVQINGMVPSSASFSPSTGRTNVDSISPLQKYGGLTLYGSLSEDSYGDIGSSLERKHGKSL